MNASQFRSRRFSSDIYKFIFENQKYFHIFVQVVNDTEYIMYTPQYVIKACKPSTGYFLENNRINTVQTPVRNSYVPGCQVQVLIFTSATPLPLAVIKLYALATAAVGGRRRCVCALNGHMAHFQMQCSKF